MIPKLMDYIFLGANFSISFLDLRRRYSSIPNGLSFNKQMQMFMASENIYERIFAYSLVNRCHPYSIIPIEETYASLRPRFSLEIKPDKLEIFGLKPIYDACFNALLAGNVAFVKEW
jgi:hypothetical protein